MLKKDKTKIEFGFGNEPLEVPRPIEIVLNGNKPTKEKSTLLNTFIIPPRSANRYSYFIEAFDQQDQMVKLELSYFFAAHDQLLREYPTAVSGLDAVYQSLAHSPALHTQITKMRVSIVPVGQ